MTKRGIDRVTHVEISAPIDAHVGRLTEVVVGLTEGAPFRSFILPRADGAQHLAVAVEFQHLRVLAGTRRGPWKIAPRDAKTKDNFNSFIVLIKSLLVWIPMLIAEYSDFNVSFGVGE